MYLKQQFFFIKQAKYKEHLQYFIMKSDSKSKIVKIIAFSDTHNMHDELQIDELPAGDIFIHCGDFTMNSLRQQLEDFKSFIQSLPYQAKVVIPGNHDHIFIKDSIKNKYTEVESQIERDSFQKICHFLEDGVVSVQGIRILGISKGPDYFDWKFDYAKNQGKQIIEKYRQKVDILITHWPPYGILDQINKKQKGGSKGLLNFCRQIKPKIHIFGHIHQGRGHFRAEGIDFYNVSNATKSYDFICQPFEIIYQE